MSRRDRATPARRMPHPAWASFQQRVGPAAKLLVIALALTAVLGGWALHFLEHSPYCWASSIEIRLDAGQQWLSDPRLGYPLHPPVHILRANLAALAEAIRREHPQLAHVTVHRELPNRLPAPGGPRATDRPRPRGAPAGAGRPAPRPPILSRQRRRGDPRPRVADCMGEVAGLSLRPAHRRVPTGAVVRPPGAAAGGERAGGGPASPCPRGALD